MFKDSQDINIDEAIVAISQASNPTEAARVQVASLMQDAAQLALNSILRRASGGRNLKVVLAALEAGAKGGAFYNQAVLNAGDNVDILRALHAYGANITLSRSFSQAALKEMTASFDLEIEVKALKTKLSLS